MRYFMRTVINVISLPNSAVYDLAHIAEMKAGLTLPYKTKRTWK